MRPSRRDRAERPEGLAPSPRFSAPPRRARLVARRLPPALALRLLRVSSRPRRSTSYADRIAMGMVGARELLPGEAPALHSHGRALSRAGGVVRRSTCSPTGFRRSRAGRGAGGGAALAVCTGLLGVATPAELEGILAHELAHLRHRDVLVQTTAVVLAARVVESRGSGVLSRVRCSRPRADGGVVRASCSRRARVRGRPPAAELCESPHGLADALVRLEQAMELVAFEASPATEPLYTINPFAEEGLAALFVTHPPVGSACCGSATSIRTGARSCALHDGPTGVSDRPLTVLARHGMPLHDRHRAPRCRGQPASPAIFAPSKVDTCAPTPAGAGSSTRAISSRRASLRSRASSARPQPAGGCNVAAG